MPIEKGNRMLRHTCFPFYIFLIFQEQGAGESRIEIFPHTFYRMEGKYIVFGKLPGRKTGQFPEYPVKMPDSIESAAGGNISNRELPGIVV